MIGMDPTQRLVADRRGQIRLLLCCLFGCCPLDFPALLFDLKLNVSQVLIAGDQRIQDLLLQSFAQPCALGSCGTKGVRSSFETRNAWWEVGSLLDKPLPGGVHFWRIEVLDLRHGKRLADLGHPFFPLLLAHQRQAID